MAEMTYHFEWDSRKASSNAKKHRVTFEEAATVFRDPLALTVFDAEHSEHEERWFTLGEAAGGTLLAVAHTYGSSGPGGARIRIITARPATKQERRFYADEPR